MKKGLVFLLLVFLVSCGKPPEAPSGNGKKKPGEEVSKPVRETSFSVVPICINEREEEIKADDEGFWNKVHWWKLTLASRDQKFTKEFLIDRKKHGGIVVTGMFYSKAMVVRLEALTIEEEVILFGDTIQDFYEGRTTPIYVRLYPKSKR